MPCRRTACLLHHPTLFTTLCPSLHSLQSLSFFTTCLTLAPSSPSLCRLSSSPPRSLHYSMPLSSLTALTPSPYTRTPPARSPKGGERVEIAVDQDDGFRLSLAKLNCIYKGWFHSCRKKLFIICSRARIQQSFSQETGSASQLSDGACTPFCFETPRSPYCW